MCYAKMAFAQVLSILFPPQNMALREFRESCERHFLKRHPGQMGQINTFASNQCRFIPFKRVFLIFHLPRKCFTRQFPPNTSIFWFPTDFVKKFSFNSFNSLWFANHMVIFVSKNTGSLRLWPHSKKRNRVCCIYDKFWIRCHVAIMKIAQFTRITLLSLTQYSASIISALHRLSIEKFAIIAKSLWQVETFTWRNS